MRLALDTNVIVRYIVEDDPSQARAAIAIIESDHTLVVSSVVLCEVCWVLGRFYRLPSTDIGRAIRGLIESDRVEVDRAVAEAGLTALAAGGDFADGCILQSAVDQDCDALMTFDRALIASGGPFARAPQ